jgi:acetylcholinesterase
MRTSQTTLALLSKALAVSAAPQLLGTVHGGGDSPQIALDYGTFRGTHAPVTGTDNFLGMPFAISGRLQNPRVIDAQDKLSRVQDATKCGTACPQQELTASPLYSGNAQLEALLATVEELTISHIDQQGEDCLNMNVQDPDNMIPEQIGKLAVMMWIHSGGFELGSSAALDSEATALPGIIYPGANIVKRSVEMGQPVVFVSANHRLNGFGTLASQEITDAGDGNLLLKDQLVAMEWVQKYIIKFGGDTTKATIFGESAGSIAIAIHMLPNDGNNDVLFRPSSTTTTAARPPVTRSSSQFAARDLPTLFSA